MSRIGNVSFNGGRLNPPLIPRRVPRPHFPRVAAMADSSARWVSVRWLGRWFQVYRPRAFSGPLHRRFFPNGSVFALVCAWRGYHDEHVVGTYTVYDGSPRKVIAVNRCLTCGCIRTDSTP